MEALEEELYDEPAPENMRFLQHHLKLVLGRMIERKIKNYYRYLRAVFDAREDFGKIVTEVYCSMMMFHINMKLSLS